MIYESNLIEGSELTHRETEILLSTDATSPGKPVAHHLWAKQLNQGWQQLKTKASLRLVPTEADLLDVQEILTGRRRNDFDLALANSLNRIATVNGGEGSDAETMGDLFLGLPEDPIEKACRLHHRITRHSRFQESSGRIARLAMNFVLLAAGYPPVSIAPQLRTAYYAALEAADSGDFPTWLAFITQRLDEEFDFWLEALSETAPAAPEP